MHSTGTFRGSPSTGWDPAGSDDPRDPRLTWSTAEPPVRPLGRAPTLRHRRDGILPAVAAALYVRGSTFTCTGGRSEDPPALHPLVQEFLEALPLTQRERFAGRCSEAVLLSQYLAKLEASRGRFASRKPLTPAEAKRALKHATLTTRRIREDGDPEHGEFAPPCRSCGPMLMYFGVSTVSTVGDPWEDG